MAADRLIYDPTIGREVLVPVTPGPLGVLTADEATALRAGMADGAFNVKQETAARQSGLNGIDALTTWWPMQEGTGATISDALNPVATATIAGTLTNVWTGAPGVNFNGSDNQITCTSQNNLYREIFSLATLNGRDQLLLWFVLSHPTTITSGALFWWGLNGSEGWGLHLLNTNSGLQWRDRPPGASTFSQTALECQRRAWELQGNGGGTNTRTAVAVSIELHRTLPAYEITVAKQSILVQGTIQQQDQFMQTVTTLPNGGTGRTRWNANGALTWGAAPTTNQSTFTGRIPSGYALCNFGAQRRAVASGGLAVRVARALARAPLAFPSALRSVA